MTEIDQKIEIEAQATVRKFIDRSEKRNWSTDDFDWDEVAGRGHLLKPRTIVLAESFLGIEALRPFYVASQKAAFGDVPSEQMFLDPWDFQEERHPRTIGLILVHSGARTQAQIDEYIAKVLDYEWSSKDHKGIADLLDLRSYRTFQERTTFVNYFEGLLPLIRSDYGLPPHNLTDMERERGYQIGAAEPVHEISGDELEHHVVNLQFVRIHLQHSPYPDETRAKITQVAEHLRMPGRRSLPNQREFVQTLRETQIYNGEIYRKRVLEPTYRALGLAA